MLTTAEVKLFAVGLQQFAHTIAAILAHSVVEIFSRAAIEVWRQARPLQNIVVFLLYYSGDEFGTIATLKQPATFHP